MRRLTRDVVVLPESDGRWVVMNVFTRTCLGVDSSSLAVLRAAETMSDAELQRTFSNNPFPVWEIGYFSNHEGLLADPSCYNRNTSQWPDPRHMEVAELTKCFLKFFFLVEDETAYRSRFSPKTSLLDTEHFGNFHEQLGGELMLKRRIQPGTWWLDQKFTKNLKGIRNNLYGAVELSFLSDYIKRKFSHGHSIVDFGCGTGFYSNLIASTGATVIGVDPSEEYINIAKHNYSSEIRFELLPIGSPGAMDSIPTGCADFVFMSDALLFYFVPLSPSMPPDINVLLTDISRILKPGGTFISVEPHYLFWLLPWLGEVNHPFTILTEYREKTFGVTATIGRLINTFTRGGFAVTWMEEMTPDPAFKQTDPRAYHFAHQFPLGQIYELKRGLPNSNGKND